MAGGVFLFDSDSVHVNDHETCLYFVRSGPGRDAIRGGFRFSLADK